MSSRLSSWSGSHSSKNLFIFQKQYCTVCGDVLTAESLAWSESLPNLTWGICVTSAIVLRTVKSCQLICPYPSQRIDGHWTRSDLCNRLQRGPLPARLLPKRFKNWRFYLSFRSIRICENIMPHPHWISFKWWGVKSGRKANIEGKKFEACSTGQVGQPKNQ